MRVQLACIAVRGDLCSGRVRIRDRAGTLASLPYAVESGTGAMEPFVTREIAPRRALRGQPRATLTH